MWKWWQVGTVAVLCGLLAACGGGGDSGSESARESPTRVVIEQTGLLLAGQGQSSQLRAKALDANGNPLPDAPTWTSSRPEVVQVDTDGRVRAASATGSAQVVARVGTITSAPLVVVVAEPAAGVRTLSDEQIVGDPVETDPTATPGRDNTYRIVLAPGIELPAIGQRMLGTGSKALAGEVTHVDGTTSTVTLRPVALRQLLPNLRVNEVIDLAQAEISIPPDIAATYDLKRNGTTLEYTPRTVVGQAGGRESALQAVGTRALSSCESTVVGRGPNDPLPIGFPAHPVFSVTLPSQLEYVDTPENGFERLLLRGETSVKIEYTVKAVAAFEGTVVCKAELGTITAPIGGLLARILGLNTTFGVGLEFGGKLTIADIGVNGSAEVRGPGEVGFACVPTEGCRFVREFDLTPTNEWSTNGPSPGDLRLDVGLAAFGYADFTLGSRVFRSLTLDAFNTKFGAKLAGSFAPQTTQILDTQYKSDYKLALEASAGIGRDLDGILRTLGVPSITVLELNSSLELGRSPSGTVSADRARFVTGDRVNFRVTLDRTDFLAGVGPYNVKKVLLVHDSAGTLQVVGTRDAVPGDTIFDFEVDATGPGSASDFHAFVVTWLMPFDYASLEIGQATGTDTALAITRTSLPSGTVGSAYAVNMSAEGGQPAYFWSATGLPGGLSIDSVSGEIRGTPGGVGSFNVRVTVLDSQGNLAERTLPMTVVEPEGPWAGTWVVSVSVTSSRSISAPGYFRSTDVTGEYKIRLEWYPDQNIYRSTVLSTSGSGAQVTTSGGTTINRKSCEAPEKNVYASVEGSSILVGGQVSIDSVSESAQGFNCLNFSRRGLIVSGLFGGGASLLATPGSPSTQSRTIDLSRPTEGISDIETQTVTVSF